MKSKYKQYKTQYTFLQNFSIKRFSLLLLALSFPAFTLAPTAFAQQSTQNSKNLTAESWCKKYTVTSENYACKDGWKGADCTDYLITHDQEHVDLCQEAARKAAEVGSGGDSEESMGVPTNNNSNNLEGLDTVKNLINQITSSQNEYAQNSSQQRDAERLKEIDNKKAANPLTHYINGNGDEQSLRTKFAAGEGNPAIIFFNGGGWHHDDQVGDKVSNISTARGYTSIVATYRLGSSGVYYQYEDVMRAIKHVRDNAALFKIDPSRIAIWGDSAGGSLAMRAAGSGKSGAAAAVGWSAPTNAYTAIFKSPQSFLIGLDHSTCVPTDINGALNTIDLINGGSGTSMPNEGGIGNNNFESIQNGDSLGTITQVLALASRAQQNGINPSSLANLTGSNGGGNSQSTRQLTSKKYIECLDNFNNTSPALYASPLTPPTFLAGFESDILIDPGQLYQMRDKLRSMGVPSSVLTLPGVAAPNTVAGENHLDYNEAFVGPSLDFLDKYLHPKKS